MSNSKTLLRHKENKVCQVKAQTLLLEQQYFVFNLTEKKEIGKRKKGKNFLNIFKQLVLGKVWAVFQ